MTTRSFIVLGLSIALAGCGENSASQSTTGTKTVLLERAPPTNVAEAAAAPIAQQSAPPPANTGVAFIAYSYALSLELPAKRLAEVQRAHAAACDAMGASRCQILNSSRNATDSDAGGATLELRIIPSEARAFQAKLETTTSSAGGKLLESAVSGEDLTRQTIDADASLKAKRTLRDRLQALLEHRDGRLADLLAVERALSDAQQQLDSATGTLAELRQRVGFSKMTVSYRSEQALGSATARPLGEAWADATTVLSHSLATMLTLAIIIVPWALVLGGLFFAARAWRRRVKAAAED